MISAWSEDELPEASAPNGLGPVLCCLSSFNLFLLRTNTVHRVSWWVTRVRSASEMSKVVGRSQTFRMVNMDGEEPEQSFLYAGAREKTCQVILVSWNEEFLTQNTRRLLVTMIESRVLTIAGWNSRHEAWRRIGITSAIWKVIFLLHILHEQIPWWQLPGHEFMDEKLGYFYV